MLDVFKLVLPALFPSWRFFDVIGPSPRVELCLLDRADDAGGGWREWRPRPLRIGFRELAGRLFWNAGWNESLFMATCAERLIQNPTEHGVREIRRRLRAELGRHADGRPLPGFFRFRLVFVSRHDDRLRRDVAFVSESFASVDPLDR